MSKFPVPYRSSYGQIETIAYLVAKGARHLGRKTSEAVGKQRADPGSIGECA